MVRLSVACTVSVCICLAQAAFILRADYFLPQQIHVALGDTPDEMVFTWTTFDDPIQSGSLVLIGEASHPSQFYRNASGEAYTFTDCGEEQTNRTIHVVHVNNLKASQLYYYQVGDVHTGFSAVYSFTTAPDKQTLDGTLPHTFIMYGDMGTTNTQACGPVTQTVLDGDINAVIHIGDFAYDMYEGNGSNGDRFMDDISVIGANTPYMVGMGNHEVYYNFSHYTQRFRGQPLPKAPAPQTVDTESGVCPNNWYYSFNYGLVHFVSVSSEIYFDFPWMIADQYAWLENDLATAMSNRSQAPWIVVYHHRPLYCTGEGGECNDQANTMRNGVLSSNKTYKYSLEALYYKYGVDLVYSGHVHNYERLYDVYQEETDQRTVNMTATTYVVVGAAGNREGHHPFNKSMSNVSWSAYRTLTFSFAKVTVHNATHLHHQQIAADSQLPPAEQGVAVDDVWFVQHHHGPFAERERLKPCTHCKKSAIYDPYEKFGIPTKIGAEPEDESTVPYISDNKEDYRGIEGVHF